MAHPRILTARDLAEVRRLVASGMARPEVAERFGVTRQAVWKRTRDLPTPPSPGRANLPRLRRVVLAGDAADYGSGADLAGRFGLAHADSFWALRVYARRRLAAQPALSHQGALS